MSNISLTNGATYTFNSNGEVISNENKCVSFKYFSETTSGQTVKLTLNDHLIDDIYGFDVYLSPYLVTNEDDFNMFIGAGDGEHISPDGATYTLNTEQYDHVVFRFYNPGNYEDTGYDIMINGILYEYVGFSGDDNLYKYVGLYINDNLTESDEIVIDIYEHVKRKQVKISFSDHYVNDITSIYLTDEDGNNGGDIAFDDSGEYDLRRYNILHILGDATDPQHFAEISIEPGLGNHIIDLEFYGAGEFDSEMSFDEFKNYAYYDSIEYMTIHFKMKWEND